MHIDPQKPFAGVPLGKVRDALASLQRRGWTVADLREGLGTDQATAEAVLRRLGDERLIEVGHQWPHGETVWRNTLRGSRLANASTSKQVTRDVARRHVESLLRRVRTVNRSKDFLYRVRRVRLFGSLLRPDRTHVSDADLALDLEPKEQDFARHRVLMEQQASRAAAAGRTFEDPRERRAYGLDEVWRYLEADSELLHLVPGDDEVLEQAPSRVLYEQEGETGS